MNRFRALVLGFATAASAAALAAYNGVFDGPQKPAAVTAAPAAVDKTDAPATAAAPAAESAVSAPAAPETAKPAETPVETAKAEPAAAEPSVPDAAAPAADPAAPAAVAAPAVESAAPAAAAMAPEFGLLRAEPDGSLLVAGKGAPGADIELITGDTMLGKTKAAANGDFAIVLSDPLKAGDYSMVLRTTNPDGKAATSVQTAIVSIPQDLKGEVLAMVEEPGKASRIITAPEAASTPAETAAAAPAEPAASETAAAAPAEPAAGETAAAAPEAPAAAVSPPKKVTIALADVAVEAVEIEGNKIFVAGSAPAGSTIRIYATEMLLGETKATANDRFLLEASRDLAVGDYFIHADTVGPDGKLISRVTVPFTREAGETVVAVAAPEAPKETAAPAAADPEKAPVAAAAEPAIAAEPETQVAAKAAEPAASDVTVAPALTKAEASVIIRRGDSLWRISKRIYGRGVRYSTIYLANKEKVKNPNRIWPGQVMMIPEKTSEGEAADMVEVEKRSKAQ